MTPIELLNVVVFAVQGIFALVLFALSVWALVVALGASDYAYRSAFKRTKTFWVAVTGGCTVFSLLGLSGGAGNLLIQLIIAIVVGVFLADVRPAVTVRR